MSDSASPPVIRVPLLDLRAQYAALRDQIMPSIAEVMESQAFVNGPAVGELEKQIADYCQTPYAIGVSSGTDALLAALMALGVGAGDHVITTPYTFFATAGVIWRMGAKPVFVDIEPDTFNIDVAKIEAAITPATRAILPVHLFGQMADMDAIRDIAQRHNLLVIEDAAQAIGATQHGRKAGSLGAVGCFSFYPTKNLGGAGDGGIITTSDESLAQRLRGLRNHGAHQTYRHQEVGGNFRLDTLQAAYLLHKLPHLDDWSAKRREHAALYDQLLADVEPVTTPRVLESNGCIFNQYVIRGPRRDALRAFLQEHGVGSAIYYPLPLHLQDCFQGLGYAVGDLPESERAAEQSLALPIYPELSEEQIRYVADQIRTFYENA